MRSLRSIYKGIPFIERPVTIWLAHDREPKNLLCFFMAVSTILIFWISDSHGYQKVSL